MYQTLNTNIFPTSGLIETDAGFSVKKDCNSSIFCGSFENSIAFAIVVFPVPFIP